MFANMEKKTLHIRDPRGKELREEKRKGKHK